MEVSRTAFQGIKNIIRFNWHFYVIAAVSILLLIALSQFLSGILVYFIYATIGFTMLAILASLAVPIMYTIIQISISFTGLKRKTQNRYLVSMRGSMKRLI